MIGWFKGRRPKPAAALPAIAPDDRLVAKHFNLTPAQWADMAPLAQQDHREEYTWQGAA